jgi:hypothetical protein
MSAYVQASQFVLDAIPAPAVLALVVSVCVRLSVETTQWVEEFEWVKKFVRRMLSLANKWLRLDVASSGDALFSGMYSFWSLVGAGLMAVLFWSLRTIRLDLIFGILLSSVGVFVSVSMDAIMSALYGVTREARSEATTRRMFVHGAAGLVFSVLVLYTGRLLPFPQLDS